MTDEISPALGIDAGSLYLKICLDHGNGAPETRYVAHHGHPVRALRETVSGLLNGVPLRVGLTGSLAEQIGDQLEVEPVDLVRAQVEAVRRVFPEVRNIMDVGGASVTLIRLTGSGEFEGMTRNSLCAAGTGSFLDEQATRLGVEYAELESYPTMEDPPHIATRCAVFAKSDLIHHQQDGRTRQECWIGLCQGMVRTLLSTLLKGRPLIGPTAVIGGVARNPEIMRRLQQIYGDQVRSIPDSHLAGAIGAASLASTEVPPEFFQNLSEKRSREQGAELSTRPRLDLHRTRYPSWEVEESYTDDNDSEVRVTRLPAGKVSCYMGVDVGSTSTKLLLTDPSGQVLCDVYRKTAGDPIGATRRLFDALIELGSRRGVEFDIRGCVSTGSGRKMVGLVIGADDIVNEISCHVKGAMHVDPEIDTIFEIGGQDSKYMRTRNGHIRDAAMNYVCAAGTGSFVEEQARKLGFTVDEVGDKVMSISPPHTSDRCTVFMEQDVNRLLRAGYTREEAMAAVMYSVVQNYFNKVVGNKYYSENKIFFQGATARNPGLVAAFENLLGVEMVVSPYAHVMGAWGAALLARELMEEKGEGASRFHGLDLSRRKIELRSERCEQCSNKCEITFAQVEGLSEEPSWGYMCGREPGEKKKVNHEFRLFRARKKLLANTGKVDLPDDAPRVAIPRSLAMHTYLPLWRRFFGELGYKAVETPVTNSEIKVMGAEIAGGDFCFPVKAALGHARYAFENTDAEYVFIPYTVSNRPNQYTSNALFCPYVQSYPSLVRTALELHGVDPSRLIAPVMDLRWKDKKQAKELFEKVGPRLGRSEKEVRKAWKAALESQREFESSCMKEGEKALSEIETEEKPAILVLGRPYNTCDPGINLGLVMKIAERGHTVVPVDFLPFDPSELGEEFENIYWSYPQRIIHAMKKYRHHDRLYPVYFTNFSCGPDSFIETYSEHLSGEKPLLILGLDEHDADAGYITRIEAFLDVVKNAEKVDRFPEVSFPKRTDDEFKRRKIWIPNMHTTGATLGAAAFRSFGYDARVLPVETDQSFETGRALTSGNECLPTVTTIGALMDKLREEDADPSKHAFFMATASGPCRFGQYALKHRLILDSLGFKDLAILAPSSLNSYQGLPDALRKKIWKLFVASDILLKQRCRVKPYEAHPGQTQAVFDEELDRLA
ncbi:MAG: acyl-CoA dehydratase activase, partial [bacterium]